MSLKCQRDSYLRRFKSRVVSCKQVEEEVWKKTKKKEKEEEERGKYEVVLEDTILFPEGGGQPYDRGTIAGVQVVKVIRRGSVAVHYAMEPLDEGTEVDIEVDWQRRFDHMQQHSAQHLITAIADRDFGHKTTSWSLAVGPGNKCFIELSTSSLSTSKLQAIQDTCNEAIRRQIPMTPRWYQSGTTELETVRSRGLPDDFEGSEVRVVEIQGIDSNMCCGTHVSNLSHLQMIKLLHTEPKRGSLLLYYIAGDRVTHYLQRAYTNERALNKLLSVSLDEHKEAVEKLMKSSRAAAKVTRSQLREIALLMTRLHLSSPTPDPFFSLHREDGDMEFMNVLGNELAPEGILVFVTVGPGKGAGHFLLAGNDDEVAKQGPKVAELMCGKGGGRKGRYQGKVSKMENRQQAEDLLRESITKSN